MTFPESTANALVRQCKRLPRVILITLKLKLQSRACNYYDALATSDSLRLREPELQSAPGVEPEQASRTEDIFM